MCPNPARRDKPWNYIALEFQRYIKHILATWNLYEQVGNFQDILFQKRTEWKYVVLSVLFKKQVVLTTKHYKHYKHYWLQKHYKHYDYKTLQTLLLNYKHYKHDYKMLQTLSLIDYKHYKHDYKTHHLLINYKVLQIKIAFNG